MQIETAPRRGIPRCAAMLIMCFAFGCDRKGEGEAPKAPAPGVKVPSSDVPLADRVLDGAAVAELWKSKPEKVLRAPSLTLRAKVGTFFGEVTGDETATLLVAGAPCYVSGYELGAKPAVTDQEVTVKGRPGRRTKGVLHLLDCEILSTGPSPVQVVDADVLGVAFMKDYFQANEKYQGPIIVTGVLQRVDTPAFNIKATMKTSGSFNMTADFKWIGDKEARESTVARLPRTGGIVRLYCQRIGASKNSNNIRLEDVIVVRP